MKNLALASILALSATSIYAETPAKMDDKKTATNSASIQFVAEALERTLYEITYDEKTGKATVKQAGQKKPFLDVTHPEGWKGDTTKADKAIRAALNEYRKENAAKGKGPATLWSAQDTKNWNDFSDGFVIGFTAPFNFLKNAFGG